MKMKGMRGGFIGLTASGVKVTCVIQAFTSGVAASSDYMYPLNVSSKRAFEQRWAEACFQEKLDIAIKCGDDPAAAMVHASMRQYRQDIEHEHQGAEAVVPESCPLDVKVMFGRTLRVCTLVPECALARLDQSVFRVACVLQQRVRALYCA